MQNYTNDKIQTNLPNITRDLNNNGNISTSNLDFSNMSNLDFSNMDLASFIDSLDIKLVSLENRTLCFDLINASPSLANAIRRIMISEIKSYAFHTIRISENESVFPDEYIAHRIGQIPIKIVNGTNKESACDNNTSGDNNTSDTKEGTLDNNTHDIIADLSFMLNVVNDTQDILSVFSNSINTLNSPVEIPQNILICKLAPGHRINMSLQISQGTGLEHAKWSLTGLCSYRLMPRIVLHREFTGEDALLLKKSLSPGVCEIVDGACVIANPRLEMMSREVHRHFSTTEVSVSRVDGHYCFTVEGLIESPVEILKRGIEVLKKKARNLRSQQ